MGNYLQYTLDPATAQALETLSWQAHYNLTLVEILIKEIRIFSIVI